MVLCYHYDYFDMLKNIRILLTDDDQRFQNDIKEKLVNVGYEVIVAFNGQEAIERAQAQEPDLILLDILMPHIDGFQVLQELREFTNVPVIILSSKTLDSIRIKGLNLGADDYIVKPFNFDELDVRIKAILNRTRNLRSGDNTEILTTENITIDLNKQSVTIKGKTVFLTLIEWQLLTELMLNPGKLIQYEQLLVKIWGPEYKNDIQLLRTWISRLRKKIEKDIDRPLIRTIRKTGYIFEGNQ